MESVMCMRSIMKETYSEIVIKNSRFICYLIPISSSDISFYLDNIKKKHPKASHYCYAYIYDSVFHSSDDGEPGGTAGMPILNVLQKEDLNHVLAVVVRYFGGTLLGAGGLVRAYTKSVVETLKISNFVDLVKGFKISITFSYEEEKNILFLLSHSVIEKREYLEQITYICLIPSDVLSNLSSYHVTVIDDVYFSKK